ncbi:MAG: ribonuclease P protein component [bacterium]|nr:ribonuclease P protein component [bacterium]
MALSRDKRLRQTKDFRTVSRNGLSAKEGKLLLKAKPSKGQVSRFGIVISKSVAKKAVERNRMRRLLKEALSAQQNSLQSPHDIVLIALPGLSLHSLKEAEDYIEKLFSKASLVLPL